MCVADARPAYGCSNPHQGLYQLSMIQLRMAVGRALASISKKKKNKQGFAFHSGGVSQPL